MKYIKLFEEFDLLNNSRKHVGHLVGPIPLKIKEAISSFEKLMNQKRYIYAYDGQLDHFADENAYTSLDQMMKEKSFAKIMQDQKMTYDDFKKMVSIKYVEAFAKGFLYNIDSSANAPIIQKYDDLGEYADEIGKLYLEDPRLIECMETIGQNQKWYDDSMEEYINYVFATNAANDAIAEPLGEPKDILIKGKKPDLGTINYN